jgi:copper resistance protein C
LPRFSEFMFSDSEKLSRVVSTEHPKLRLRQVLMGKLVFAVSAMVLGLAGPALAHAVLVSTVPAVRASVSGPEVVFRLKFNSRIDAARSTLKLVLPDMKVLSLDMGAQPSPDSLTARSTDLKPGSYTLLWQVLATDGHITRGEVPFAIR